MEQQLDRNAALETIAIMRLGKVVPLTESLALYAASLGRELRLPLADSIILTTARAFNATLWTQDAHFESIEGGRYFK